MWLKTGDIDQKLGVNVDRQRGRVRRLNKRYDESEYEKLLELVVKHCFQNFVLKRTTLDEKIPKIKQEIYIFV